MILLDPDLDPSAAADAPKATLVKRSGVSGSKPHSKGIPRDIRLPSARTLAGFLAAAQAAVRVKGQVSVLLTTDAAIKKLNRQFRGKNTATDVLSFPASGLGGIAGDLAISVTTALGQAAEQGHSLATEIKVLVLHGLLHLAGLDHEVDDGKMARRERVLRAKLRLPLGLIERAGRVQRAALKGHGFSRAATSPKRRTALAAKGIPVVKKDSPQGLKPKSFSSTQSARLKSSPFKTPASLEPFKTSASAEPFKTSGSSERGELNPHLFKSLPKAKRL
jgi:probable rRNA maturation factor